MGTVIRREPCPLCRQNGEDKSGDNRVIYEDLSGMCFHCDMYFYPDGRHKTFSDYNEKYEEQSGQKIQLVNVKNKHPFLSGDYINLGNRGISKETCKSYRYQVITENSQTKHIANYFDLTGKLRKQKIRLVNDKKFYNLGDTRYMGLFGMQLWHPNKKIHMTMTTGELDTLSIAELNSCQYPVVSLPDGDRSVEKCLLSNLDWILGWKHVVLAYDGDRSGRTALEMAIDILYRSPIFCVNWPENIKDANDLKKCGKDDVLVKVLQNSAPVVPDSIVDLGTMIEKSLDPKPIGHSWGWSDLDKATYRIRLQELILIGAGSSVGKTTFLNQVCLHLISEYGEKVGIISFEQTPEDIIQRLAGSIVNQRIWLPGCEYDRQTVINAAESIKGKAYAIDTSKGVDTVEKVINKIMYLVNVIGIKYIFLDHLTCVASMISGDERRGLDSVMVTLSRIIKELDCTIFAVSHLAKPTLYESRDPNTSKTFEQGRNVVSTDFRGSQSLQYYPTLILSLSRDIYETNSKLLVETLKNRIDGDTVGSIVRLDFNRDTGKYSQVNEII